MKSLSGCREMFLKRITDLIGAGWAFPKGYIVMNAAIARLLPTASVSLVHDLESLVSTALFCGIGLLLSLSVLILDQYIPGEWF
jgi:hypothetical protein